MRGEPTHGFLVGHLAVEVSVVGRTAGKVTHGRGSGLTVTRAERPDGIGGGGGGPSRPKCCHSHVAAAPFVNCLCLPIGRTQKNCSTGKKNRRSFIFPPYCCSFAAQFVWFDAKRLVFRLELSSALCVYVRV